MHCVMYRPQNFLLDILPHHSMYNSALSGACFSSFLFGRGGQTSPRKEFNLTRDVLIVLMTLTLVFTFSYILQRTYCKCKIIRTVTEMKWSTVFVLVFPVPAAAFEKVVWDKSWGIIDGNSNQSSGRVQIDFWNVPFYGLGIDYKVFNYTWRLWNGFWICLTICFSSRSQRNKKKCGPWA